MDEIKGLIKETNEILKEKDEESEFLVQCNIKTMKVLYNKIKDKEIKNETLKRINELIEKVDDTKVREEYKNMFVEEINKSRESLFDEDVQMTQNKRVIKKDVDELVEEEMLKNSQKLHEMSVKFNKTLELDKKTVEKSKEAFVKNTKATSSATKTLTEIEQMGTWSYLGSSLCIFIVMYLVIKIL